MEKDCTRGRPRKPRLLALVLEEDRDTKKQRQADRDRGDGSVAGRVPIESGPEHKKQIVLVDDELAIREMLQSMLRLRGFEILASLSDGTQVVDLMNEPVPKPDVILLDERMPRMSGIEACKAIHSINPKIPIIFISADESAKERVKEAGAMAFLQKPISIHELVFLLNSV
ncbi:MAG: response regulator [Nitrososphaerales archaeon]